MIKINLLPVEKRKPERTPLPRFGLILANVAAAGILVILAGIELIRVVNLTRERNEKEETAASLRPVVAEFKATEEKNKALQAKLQEIRSISGAPIEWWRAIDALWDVINDNQKVWIDDLTMLENTAAKQAAIAYDPATKITTTPYGLSFSCHVAGVDVALLTKFRNDIRLNPILRGYFREINFNPDWTVEDQADAAEKYSLGFKVQMIGADKPAAPAQPQPAGATTGARP